MAPPMRSAAGMCAVMCALLPAALSHTVETEFVSIPKGGWRVFEVPRDARYTLLRDIKFTNRQPIQGCDYARLEAELKGATVHVYSRSSVIHGVNSTSTVFFGRNTVGDTVSANVTAEYCNVELQAAFNFYELLDAAVVQKVQNFELSGTNTYFTVSLLPPSLYVESVTLTMVSPCPGAEDGFMLDMGHPSSRAQIANLTEVGQELTTPVEGMVHVILDTDATGGVSWVRFIASGNCTPAVEVNVRSRQVVVSGSPAPPTFTPFTITPYTPYPIPNTDDTEVVVWVLVSLGIAAAVSVCVGAGIVIYCMMCRAGSAKPPLI